MTVYTRKKSKVDAIQLKDMYQAMEVVEFLNDHYTIQEVDFHFTAVKGDGRDRRFSGMVVLLPLVAFPPTIEVLLNSYVVIEDGKISVMTSEEFSTIFE